MNHGYGLRVTVGLVTVLSRNLLRIYCTLAKSRFSSSVRLRELCAMSYDLRGKCTSCYSTTKDHLLAVLYPLFVTGTVDACTT